MFSLQMGEKDWERLTELQRQRKVLEMKKKERRLRREGKMDEINVLMGLKIIHSFKVMFIQTHYRSFGEKRKGCCCSWLIFYSPLKKRV